MVDSSKRIYDHLKENLKVLFTFIPKIAYKTSLNTRNLSKSDELFFFEVPSNLTKFSIIHERIFFFNVSRRAILQQLMRQKEAVQRFQQM
jgi:hypothetical protein